MQNLLYIDVKIEVDGLIVNCSHEISWSPLNLFAQWSSCVCCDAAVCTEQGQVGVGSAKIASLAQK